MRVKPWEDLDLETHWGWLDVRDKVVLDVGADYGSTADFFLSRGAAGVIAVEGDPRSFRRLKAFTERAPNVKAIQKRVASVADWRELLTSYTAHVVKVDCEGGEGFLLELDDHLFSRPEAWAVELHTREQAERWGNPYPWRDVGTLWMRFLEKLLDSGYEVVKDVPHWTGRVVCGVRGDLHLLSRPGNPGSRIKAVIVGTQRVGTHLIEKCLASHPNVESGVEVLMTPSAWATWSLQDFFQGGKAEVRVCRLTHDQVTDVAAVWLQMTEARIIHVIQEGDVREAQVERFRRLFQSGPYLELAYQEMVGCEGEEISELPTKLSCKLCRFLDLDPHPLTSSQRKQNPGDPRSFVLNYDELMEATGNP